MNRNNVTQCFVDLPSYLQLCMVLYHCLSTHTDRQGVVDTSFTVFHQLYFTKTGRDKKNNKTDKKNLTRKT